MNLLHHSVLIQTGPNKFADSSEFKFAFAVSAFEIYGQLQQKIKVEIVEKQYTYAHDLDKNGIIYGLGGLVDRKLAIYSSGVASGKKIEDFLSREDVLVWTSNEEYSWVLVDFKDKSVVPSHYTMRYGSSGNFCCPRNWLLQGSNKPEAIKVMEIFFKSSNKTDFFFFFRVLDLHQRKIVIGILSKNILMTHFWIVIMLLTLGKFLLLNVRHIVYYV